jgi:cellulose synthase (UDP-forming)
MVSVTDALTASFGIIGGSVVAFFGISKISMGSSGLFYSTQVVLAFSLCYYAVLSAVSAYANLSEAYLLGIAGAAGVVGAAVMGFLTFITPWVVIFLTGALTAPYILIIDSQAAHVVPADNKLAREQFAIWWTVIFFLAFLSSSKSTDRELHRWKYMFMTAILGGWMLSDAVVRLAYSPTSATSLVFDVIESNTSGAFNELSTGEKATMFAVWAGVALIGCCNQLMMRWGFFCYEVKEKKRAGPRRIDAEPIGTLQPGDTLAAQTEHTMQTRVVCENCFATVPADQAFCTECGESLENENSTAEPSFTVSQAFVPQISQNPKSKVPNNWKEVSYAPTVALTSFVEQRKDNQSFMAGNLWVHLNIRSDRFASWSL